jgi:sugar phosphate isomerase/epimerase
MFFSGLSDEAGVSLDEQIRAHRELGWTRLEMRSVRIGDHPAANLHDISDEDFEIVERRLREEEMEVYCFASMVANGKRKMHEPFEATLEEVRRAVIRMKRLGTRFIRIMSFGICWDSEDQQAQERFRRLRIVVERFASEGLIPWHENCGNYGGLSPRHTLELLEEVPGLGILFDTGNPVFSDDRSRPKPWPKQSAWEFYQALRGRIDHVHIKDGIWNAENQKTDFCFPGDGDGDVARIVRDLMASGYSGGLSIEPHISVSAPASGSHTTQASLYVAYGRRLERLVAETQAEISSRRA